MKSVSRSGFGWIPQSAIELVSRSSRGYIRYNLYEVDEGECPDDFVGLTVTVVGKGKNKKDAEDAFDKYLKAMKKDAAEKLACGTKACEDEDRECVFDYAPTGDRECKEIKRKTVLHNIERKWWQCTQEFDLGCFCISKLH